VSIRSNLIGLLPNERRERCAGRSAAIPMGKELRRTTKCPWDSPSTALRRELLGRRRKRTSDRRRNLSREGIIDFPSTNGWRQSLLPNQELPRGSLTNLTAESNYL
jgi:hypothetical protein